MLIAEITLGILLLVYPNKAEETIKSGMKDVFNNYGIDEAIERSIDIIETDVSFTLKDMIMIKPYSGIP